MQKKRAFAFFVLGLLSLMFLVQFVEVVSAQTQGPDAFRDFFRDGWDDIIQSFQTGNGISEQLARIIYFVIVALLVYSVSDRIPGMSGQNKGWVRTIISGIIAFLSVAYLTTADIYALLLSYSALGFALGTIIPFFILLIFSYDTLANSKISNKFIQTLLIWVIWGSFGGWTFYRAFTFDESGDAVAYARPALWLITGLCLVAVLFATAITHAIVSGRIAGDLENFGEKGKRTRAAMDTLSDITRGDTQSGRDRI